MVPAMRFLVAVVPTLAVLAAAPALAADSTVSVGDDFYDPSTPTTVNPGEKVTWDWQAGSQNDHTVTSNSRQIDSFRSRVMAGGGASFTHTFKYAGSFRYVCLIHPFSMQARVIVGTDNHVAPKITSLKARVSGRRVKVSFRLSERSLVTASVKGRKKVVKVYGAGKHSITFKSLRRARNKASLSAKDGFGHTGKKSTRFRVR
jgi:plastocyanin